MRERSLSSISVVICGHGTPRARRATRRPIAAWYNSSRINELRVRAHVHPHDDSGVTDIVLMGASKGGTAIVAAGAAISPAPKALVSLSGPAQFNGADALAAAPKLTSPVLYVAGSDDAGFAFAAERLGKATPPAVRRGVLIVPGAQHGTSLLGGEGFEKVTAAIESLLAKDAPPLP